MDGTGDTTALTMPAVLEIKAGTMLGEFRLEERVGEGGMGVVFSAVHPLIGKRAAVKILRHELCRDPDQVERFVDEARAVNRIGHPNIVDVFAFGEMPDGRSYFVMEWLQGESLRARLDRGPMSIHEMCDVVKPLARALEAAHEKGVIHRDLKPDNVFLVEQRDDERPQVKLLDFGIAKLQRTDRTVEKTATGAIIGTPKYIAPEQAKGHAIDPRVDVYSLGTIAFEMLAGRSVFEADNAMEMVAKHLMEAAPRLSQFAKVPRELDDLVRAMLAKDPAERPALSTIIEKLDRAKARTKAGRAATKVPARASTSDIARTSVVDIPGHAPARRRSRLLLLGGVAGALAAASVAFVIVRSLGGPAAPPAPPAAPGSPAASAPPAPIVEHPAAVAPAAAPAPTVEKPAIEKPAVEQPAIEQPTIDMPAAAPAVSDKPRPKAHATAKPAVHPKPVKSKPRIELPDDPDGIMDTK